MLTNLFGRKDQSGTQTPKNENQRHKPKKPTFKQEKFVEGVIQHGNATRAARDAGYSPRSAAVLASRNLKRPDIQEQIKARIEAAKLDTDEIVGTLIGHMRADIGQLFGDDGALDLVRAIENGSTHIIKRLTIRKRRIAKSQAVREGVEPIEETTYDIVLHDAQSAARHLARLLHLEEKNRPVGPTSPTDDELANRMADLLERARANGRKQGRREIEGSIQPVVRSETPSQSEVIPPPNSRSSNSNCDTRSDHSPQASKLDNQPSMPRRLFGQLFTSAQETSNFTTALPSYLPPIGKVDPNINLYSLLSGAHHQQGRQTTNRL
jgi:phage terminase small subunit